MKKALIICHSFYPINRIGSIRPTKIVKYLTTVHHMDVAVVSVYNPHPSIAITGGAIPENWEVPTAIRIQTRFVLGKYKPVPKDKLPALESCSYGRKMGLLRNCRKSLGYLARIVQQYWVLHKAYEPLVKEHKIGELKEYDLIFSTFGPLSVHLIAKKLKQYAPQAVWIADFRDPIATILSPHWFHAFSRWFMRHVVDKADAVTAVSTGSITSDMVTTLPTTILPNGYDRDDLPLELPVPSKEQFTLVYTGTLIYNLRDLRRVFEALRALLDEGVLHCERLCIRYAGVNSDLFRAQLVEYDLLDCAQVYDSVPREQAIALQLSAHILLLASWNMQTSQGVTTGKFLEYLMMNRPILCEMSGNVVNSELKHMIEENRLGFCFEQAAADIDYPLLKQYLMEQYRRFEAGQPLQFDPDYAFVEQFDYRKLTDKLVSYMEEIREHA